MSDTPPDDRADLLAAIEAENRRELRHAIKMGVLITASCIGLAVLLFLIAWGQIALGIGKLPLSP